MTGRILSHAELIGLIDLLGASRRLIGPVRRGDHAFYEPVEGAARLALDAPQCVYSPKSFLFPPEETLLTFEKDSGSFVAQTVLHDAPIALIAVRPCELHGIRLLDHVFAAPPGDAHYEARRRQTFILGMDCAEPCRPEAFCADMGTNTAHLGFDLLATPLTNSPGAAASYALEAGSEAGENALAEFGRGRAPSAADEAAFAQRAALKRQAFPKHLACDVDELPAALQRGFGSKLWAQTAQRCYSCGSCNLVCPTCYCFNIRDDISLDGNCGSRVREWDGCQLRDFALVAGGHNFRPDPAQRLRHRVMRKGRWIQDRTGLPGCVGCGRCDGACTAKISIREMFNALAEEASHDGA